MKRKTYSTFSKVGAMLMLVVLPVLVLLDAAALVVLSETGSFFDNGTSLRRMLYEDAVDDAYSKVFNTYLLLRLDGRSIDPDFIDEVYSEHNSNLFFYVTDEGGNVLYQNFTAPLPEYRYKSTSNVCEYEILESVYNGGGYWLDEESALDSSITMKAGSLTGKDGMPALYISEAPSKNSFSTEAAETITIDTTSSSNLIKFALVEKEDEKEPEYRTVTLTFNCFIRQKLTAKDKLYYLVSLADFIVANRALLTVGCIVGVIATILLFIFLLCSAGHHRGKDGEDELAPEPLDSVPLDIYIGFAGIFCALLAYAALRVLAASYYFSLILRCTFTMLCVIGVELLILSVILTFATRIKCGRWWRTTLTYSILALIFRMLRWFFRKLNYILSNISAVWKALLAYAMLTLVEFIILVSAELSTVILWWALEKLVFGLIGFFLLTDWKKLFRGAQAIASGESDSRIDARGMYGELKRHAAHLNSIGDGVQRAVNDRLKSERFKTELITNVSHDLKTPLTSIVNYVDLMKKEDIQPEKAKEHLEVLDRQSKRLQKLTVDLVEASKASTGNLPVNAEQADILVFFSQLAGEYEEKLEQTALELVVTCPEENVYIFADGRLMWRVFDNLMNNICKYAQPSTRVYITASVTEYEVVLSFKNISRFPLNISSDKLMERFVRGDASRNTEGSGLGLSIARSLVDLQKGKFELVVDGDLFKVILTFDRYYPDESEEEA